MTARTKILSVYAISPSETHKAGIAYELVEVEREELFPPY